MLFLRSPAKVNLFLQIRGRCSDGYHELASLFQAISLCDHLHFKESECDLLTCSDPTLPVDHTNLISKAVHLFRSKTGIKRHWTIHVQKNIPQQAGLGGGSSNAATTLWALNALHGKPATEDELVAWGAALGSDVPFFLSSGTAYCTGRGEVIRSLSPLQNATLWIVKPKEGLPTVQVYAKLKECHMSTGDPQKALTSFFNGSSTYFNDLEKPAFDLLPSLATLKQKLLNFGFSNVLMSGSGSSFFCVGEADPADVSDCLTFKVHYLQRQSNFWY